MIETTKKALYVTVGAPVLTARRVNEKFQEITSKLRDANLGADLRKEVDAWAAEGQKLVDRLGNQPIMEEFSARIDDIDLSSQVGKLREQLDEMLENWRQNFRPATAPTPVKKGEATSAPSVPAQKPATKVTTTTKTGAAKTGAAKASTAKKPAAKATANKKQVTKATKKA